MVIRCEACSTLYELDEGLLSPAGSQVQCTRCQHVFKAFPPRAPGRTLVGVPAQAAEPPTASERPAGAARRAVSGGAAHAPASAARPEAPRPVRTAPPPVYRPATPSPPPAPGVGRPPLIRRDTVGTFENRLRWIARMRWLAPLAVASVVVAGIAVWWGFSRPGDGGASRVRAEAMALLSIDDGASVEQAIARLDGVLRSAPRAHAAAADRALAHVVWAAGLVEEGESLAARHQARSAERERLRKEQPEGWEDAERAAAAEAQRLALEVREREERARSLGGVALQALRRLQTEVGDAPEVARALAAFYALGGEHERARSTARAAREHAPADPWLALAEGWADARDPDRAARERALIELGALSAAHPELLRARYLLARTQAGLGHRAEALATLSGLLAANARHGAAKRLHDELSAPPRAPAPAPAPPEEPPPVNPPAQKRKRVAQPPVVAAPAPPAELPSGTPAADPAASQPAPAGSAPDAASASPPAPHPEPPAVPPATPPGAGEPARRHPNVDRQSSFLEGG